MNKVRGNRWRVSLPKTIFVDNLKAIVESLNSFMPGLDTKKRNLKAQSITDSTLSTLEGTDCWKVYQPFAFDKIQKLQIELTLFKDEKSSCQLHLEFSKNRIFLSVSDIGTDWRDAVFEEMERILKNSGIFKGEWFTKITESFIRLQNVFLILGVFLIISQPKYQIDFSFFAVSLLFIGIIPVFGDILRIYFPQKPITILEEKRSPFPIIKIEKFAMWIGIISGSYALIKEFVLLFIASNG